MVTPRNPVRTSKITAEALALWRTVNDILDNASADKWEEDGGRRREYLTKTGELNNALGLSKFDRGPADCGDVMPVYLKHNAYQAACWRRAKKLRDALLEAEATNGKGEAG